MEKADWAALAAAISKATGSPFSVVRHSAMGGGCINAAWRIEGNGRCYFVKVNEARKLPMFEAEADGLNEIRASRTIRVPAPVCFGVADDQSWLVLDYLEMGSGSQSGAAELGAALARMHHVTADQFGWRRDNTIGDTPQINTWTSDWIRFWREHRLGFQLRLAAQNGYRGRLQAQGEKLQENLGTFFTGHAPKPSLLHGDLWGGNYGFDVAGRPVLFDPAVYYGDREADLAMTELFGGFPSRFYSAYSEAFPLDPGYRTRRTLYNLYHILNHLNLFGTGYLSQADEMIARLLSETE